MARRISKTDRDTQSQSREITISPFLKWAGGKRWLSAYYPEIFPSKFDRYVEPFLGSGAAFFYLRPEYAVLSDLNHELISTYQAIRDNWHAVLAALKRHQRNHSTTYYYTERKRIRRSTPERAARFLYLNRTCWNGLYRVNLRGEFNVPKGTKNNIVLPTDNFSIVSTILKNTSLLSTDFENVIDDTRNDDFLFIDPPYITKHVLNGFIKYNEKLFTWDDQIRLACAVSRAAQRGVKILVTNADHQAIRELYCKFGHLKTLERASIIAGDKSCRGGTTELAVIINYDPKEGANV